MKPELLARLSAGERDLYHICKVSGSVSTKPMLILYESLAQSKADLAKAVAMLKKHQYRNEHCVECKVFFADGCPSRCAYAALVKEE